MVRILNGYVKSYVHCSSISSFRCRHRRNVFLYVHCCAVQREGIPDSVYPGEYVQREKYCGKSDGLFSSNQDRRNIDALFYRRPFCAGVPVFMAQRMAGFICGIDVRLWNYYWHCGHCGVADILFLSPVRRSDQPEEIPLSFVHCAPDFCRGVMVCFWSAYERYAADGGTVQYH